MGIQKTSKKAAAAKAAKEKKNAGNKKGVLSIARCKVCGRSLKVIGEGKKKDTCGICSPVPKIHKSVLPEAEIEEKAKADKAKADKAKADKAKADKAKADKAKADKK